MWRFCFGVIDYVLSSVVRLGLVQGTRLLSLALQTSTQLSTSSSTSLLLCYAMWHESHTTEHRIPAHGSIGIMARRSRRRKKSIRKVSSLPLLLKLKFFTQFFHPSFLAFSCMHSKKKEHSHDHRHQHCGAKSHRSLSSQQ